MPRTSPSCSSSQCVGRTRKGARCKKCAVPPTIYCHLHQFPLAETLEEEVTRLRAEKAAMLHRLSRLNECSSQHCDVPNLAGCMTASF